MCAWRYFIRYTITGWKTTTSSNFCSAWAEFGFKPLHSRNIILHFEGTKRIPNLSTLSFRWSRDACNLREFLLSRKHSPYRSQFPPWTNINAVIPTKGTDEFRKHPSKQNGKVGCKWPILMSNQYEEFGRKVAASTNSVSPVRRRRYDW